jgi:hypothetical protein
MPDVLSGWIVFVAGAAGIVFLQHYAARRVRQGDSRYLWLVFATALLAGAALVVVAAAQATQQPLVSLAIGALGLFMLAVTVRLVVRMRRALDEAPAGADFGRIFVDLGSDYVLALVIVGLVIGIGGGLLLVALAVMEGRG